MNSTRKKIIFLGLAIGLLIQGCERSYPTSLDESITPSISAAPPATAGKIVVNHDEWTLTNTGFTNAPDAGTFALNVASWFTDGLLGNFLVYSNNFGLVGSQLATVMTGAGHTWTIVNPTTAALPVLDPFDAVFVSGNNVDNQPLIDYVNVGGNVYLAGGTASIGSAQQEADAWNTFLNAFGLHYGAPYNNVTGTLPITSSHPIFTGVSALYQNNGNSVSELDPTDPNTDILEFSGPHGLYGVFELFEPPNTAPIADAGPDAVIECTGLGTSVTLDGSASTDADGDALTYTWMDSAGNVIATGVSPTVTLGLGVHVITLEVSDGELAASDDVVITIVDTVAPEINIALFDRHLWSHHQKARLVARVSASDVCDPSPVLVVEVAASDDARKYHRRRRDRGPRWEVVDNGDGTFDVYVLTGRRHRRPDHWSPEHVAIPMGSSAWHRERDDDDDDDDDGELTITATATDASGNTAVAIAVVSLDREHDGRKRRHDKDD